MAPVCLVRFEAGRQARVFRQASADCNPEARWHRDWVGEWLLPCRVECPACCPGVWDLPVPEKEPAGRAVFGQGSDRMD